MCTKVKFNLYQQLYINNNNNNNNKSFWGWGKLTSPWPSERLIQTDQKMTSPMNILIRNGKKIQLYRNKSIEEAINILRKFELVALNTYLKINKEMTD